MTTFLAEARADRCGCRSLLMASAAGLSVACFCHGLSGSRPHAFRCRRVVVVEPGRRLRHRLHGTLLRWSGPRVHRDRSDMWLHPCLMSRCLNFWRISSPRSMWCAHLATLLSVLPAVADDGLLHPPIINRPSPLVVCV